MVEISVTVLRFFMVSIYNIGYHNMVNSLYANSYSHLSLIDLTMFPEKTRVI